MSLKQKPVFTPHFYQSSLIVVHQSSYVTETETCLYSSLLSLEAPLTPSTSQLFSSNIVNSKQVALHFLSRSLLIGLKIQIWLKPVAPWSKFQSVTLKVSSFLKYLLYCSFRLIIFICNGPSEKASVLMVCL